MAQSKNKRRRKHRGTQSGTLDRKRQARPRSRKEAEARAKSRQAQKRDQPPTWGGATVRGLVAAGVFFALVVLLFKQSVAQGLAVSLLMLTFYIPMGYFMDRFFWRRRQLKEQRERQATREQRKG